MSSMLRRLPPVALGVILLAGCGGVPAGSPPHANDPASRPASPPPATRVDSPPPAGGVDAPPSDGTEGPPTASGTVPGACGLITAGDVAAVTSGSVRLLFPYPKREEPPHDESAAYRGITSVCHLRLQSIFDTAKARTAIDGEVVLRIQSDGTSAFFPPRASVGDTPVSGLGDEAFSRYGILYVRLGTGMVTIEVHITINLTADRAATMASNLDVALKLAPIVINRV